MKTPFFAEIQQNRVGLPHVLFTAGVVFRGFYGYRGLGKVMVIVNMIFNCLLRPFHFPRIFICSDALVEVGSGTDLPLFSLYPSTKTNAPFSFHFLLKIRLS